MKRYSENEQLSLFEAFPVVNKDLVTSNEFGRTIGMPSVSAWVFQGTESEILRLNPNGDIYVNGKLIENDKEVVDGMRDFLASLKG